MAKKSMIARENKRKKLVSKYAKKRASLKEIISSEDATPAEKWEANIKLQKMPVDSSKSRKRDRCFLTGRPNGTFRKFGLCRHKVRELAMEGYLPGVTKASW